MPRHLNHDVYCNVPPDTVPLECVLHFVGSPKPWDPFGPWLHECHGRWAEWVERTALPSRWRVRYASPTRFASTSVSAWRWYRKRAVASRAR